MPAVLVGQIQQPGEFTWCHLTGQVVLSMHLSSSLLPQATVSVIQLRRSPCFPLCLFQHNTVCCMQLHCLHSCWYQTLHLCNLCGEQLCAIIKLHPVRWQGWHTQRHWGIIRPAALLACQASKCMAALDAFLAPILYNQHSSSRSARASMLSLAAAFACVI